MFARTTFLAALLLALGASSFGPVQAQQAPGDVEMRELDLMWASRRPWNSMAPVGFR